jgi:Ca-activated chloride channel family protein
MSRARAFLGLLLFTMLTGPAGVIVRAGDSPLSETDVVKRLQILANDELVAEVRKKGINFAVDDGVLKRLESAGASSEVLDALRKARHVVGEAAKVPLVTYGSVLELLKAGVDEAVILKRLEKSPTVFTLDEAQIQTLKQAGASDQLLSALQSPRSSGPNIGDVSDLVVILDCSGSMNGRTPDRRAKIEVAKEVIGELISSIPDGRRLCLIVYGHKREGGCRAVEVLRHLSPLDDGSRREVVDAINRLEAVGATPIALALQTAGRELAKAEGNCGLILLTDGMETCNGDPKREAAKLALLPNLTFGIHVIGFGVERREKAGVESIALAGKGKFYDARSATTLKETVVNIRKGIVKQKAPPPPPEAPTPQVSHALPVRGKCQNGLVIEITAMRRTSDNLLRVDFNISNPTEETIDSNWVGFKFWNNLYYVEAGRGSKCEVAKDSRGDFFSASLGGQKFGSHDKKNYWMKFPLPHAGVRQVSFYFYDTEPIEDVAVPGAAPPDAIVSPTEPPASVTSPQAEPAEAPTVAPMATGKLQNGLVIQITGIKRTSDNLLRVDFSISNPTEDTVDAYLNGFGFWNDLYYIEEGGRYKASVARAGGEFFSARISSRKFAPREKADYWAKFAAPHARTRTISFYFKDAEPIEDVPLAAGNSSTTKSGSEANRSETSVNGGPDVGRPATKRVPAAVRGLAPGPPQTRRKRFVGYGRSQGAGRAQTHARSDDESAEP